MMNIDSFSVLKSSVLYIFNISPPLVLHMVNLWCVKNLTEVILTYRNKIIKIIINKEKHGHSVTF